MFPIYLWPLDLWPVHFWPGYGEEPVEPVDLTSGIVFEVYFADSIEFDIEFKD
jgi:hypothetical protein